MEQSATSDRVLVAYASRFGSTKEVAERVGSVLRRCGHHVDVRPVDDRIDLSRYGAVVVGSPIRGDRWAPEAIEFVESHRAELSVRPVAYFLVCLTMMDDTPGARREAEGFLDHLRIDVPEVQPVSIGLFAGAVFERKLPLSLKVLTRLARTPRGDFRDWTKIRRWAGDVAEMFRRSAVAP